MVDGLNRDGSILFLSCDLQNSTRFKQVHTKGWIATFLAFYTEFPSMLAAEVATSYKDLRGRLSLWKAVGDELIFSIRIQSEKECSDSVDAWLEAMLVFEKQHLNLKTTMTLKGGAFLATVPSPDRRVAIPRIAQYVDAASQIDAEAQNEKTLNEADHNLGFVNHFAMDFVGPSIDTGFRVLKFASHEYFVLTVEVAHLLFKHYNDSDKRDRNAFLLGTHCLKGVWGDKPYPIFAIARTLEENPARLLAAAFGDGDNGGLVTEQYAHRKPSQVLTAIEAYRSADDWQGAIHLPKAHEVGFQQHPTLEVKRRELDSLTDTSEDLLQKEDDRGEIGSVDTDFPLS